MSKTPMTWGDLVESANNHAAEYDCEVVLEDGRAGDEIQFGAAPVRVYMSSESMPGSEDPDVAQQALLSQVAVVDGVAILKVEDQETGSVSLVGARGVDLFRILYV
jgi:hypothetical protein